MQLDLAAYKEFIHFGLTSQDINNTAIPLSLKEAAREIILFRFTRQLVQQLLELWQTDWARSTHAGSNARSASLAYSLGQRITGFCRTLARRN